MACPRKRKFCQQTFFYRYKGGGWFCGGVLKKKAPNSPAFDICRHCFNTASTKGPFTIDARPEEAILGAICYLTSALKFLDGFKAYDEWYAEHDR
jgi:hypothetical protein